MRNLKIKCSPHFISRIYQRLSIVDSTEIVPLYNLLKTNAGRGLFRKGNLSVYVYYLNGKIGLSKPKGGIYTAKTFVSTFCSYEEANHNEVQLEWLLNKDTRCITPYQKKRI